MLNRGVKRPKKFEKLIESLVDRNDQNRNNAPFETYASLIAFAAVIGAKFSPDDFCCDYSHYGDPIRLNYFGEDKVQFIELLAVYNKKELSILTDENDGKEKISIFEGYAYAGLKKIKSIIDRPGGRSLDNLIDFVQTNIDNDGKVPMGEEVDLSSLMSN